jgi:hypothetical protein
MLAHFALVGVAATVLGSPLTKSALSRTGLPGY